MILDLERFVREERPYWDELEERLGRLSKNIEYRMDLLESQRFYYLYRRTASDLARIQTFAAEPALRSYLEGLSVRAYAEIHETRELPHRVQPLVWLLHTFPACFRRQIVAFAVTVITTLAGCALGGGAVYFDSTAKYDLLPFGHGEMSPSQRVQEEEQERGEHLEGQKTRFASMLMTHNIKVSVFTMALGIGWGFGTLVLLFYNGVILGGIAVDYIRAGESVFLAGWLLPHGSVEIPAILIAGQAGLVLGAAVIGWGSSAGLRERLRAVGADVMTLILGVMVLLVWAGIVEAFFSQYHEPVVPYALKIAFGSLQLFVLFAYLLKSGIRRAVKEDRGHG